MELLEVEEDGESLYKVVKERVQMGVPGVAQLSPCYPLAPSKETSEMPSRNLSCMPCLVFQVWKRLLWKFEWFDQMSYECIYPSSKNRQMWRMLSPLGTLGKYWLVRDSSLGPHPSLFTNRVLLRQ